MSEKYFPPQYGEGQFHCPHCNVYAKQFWGFLNSSGRVEHGIRWYPKNESGFGEELSDSFTVSKCEHCNDLVFWHNDKMIYPKSITVEPVNEDLNDEARDLYNEAAVILHDSPRAAAVLLRLALQSLLRELGGDGRNINNDIATIVKQGVDRQVQKALDIIRVFGNNGAHDSSIDLNEKLEDVQYIFSLINFVADKMITQKKEIDELYGGLPEGIKSQIEKRDKEEA